jgi:hypothetical protein
MRPLLALVLTATLFTSTLDAQTSAQTGAQPDPGLFDRFFSIRANSNLPLRPPFVDSPSPPQGRASPGRQ